jgi:methyltransferase (TIGR00027 family)
MNGHPLFIEENAMRAGQPSRTADQNALFRALEARRPAALRIADDPLALRFLSPEFRVLAEAARVPAARRLLEAVIDRRWPCVRPGVVARTRLIDQTVLRELGNVGQVLILGAGFDSRAWRLPGMDQVRVFELDHPATQAAKQRALRGRQAAASVCFVPVVFGADDPSRALAASGFTAGAPTLVLWEGVTNYLQSEAVDATFALLARLLGSGSPVLFTYVDAGMLDGSAAFAGAETTMRAVRRVGEPFTFGFIPAELATYLAERHFQLQSDERVSDAAQRFYPVGRCPPAPAYYHVVESRRH